PIVIRRFPQSAAQPAAVRSHVAPPSGTALFPIGVPAGPKANTVVVPPSIRDELPVVNSVASVLIINSAEVDPGSTRVPGRKSKPTTAPGISRSAVAGATVPSVNPNPSDVPSSRNATVVPKFRKLTSVSRSIDVAEAALLLI